MPVTAVKYFLFFFYSAVGGGGGLCNVRRCFRGCEFDSHGGSLKYFSAFTGIIDILCLSISVFIINLYQFLIIYILFTKNKDINLPKAVYIRKKSNPSETTRVGQTYIR